MLHWLIGPAVQLQTGLNDLFSARQSIGTYSKSNTLEGFPNKGRVRTTLKTVQQLRTCIVRCTLQRSVFKVMSANCTCKTGMLMFQKTNTSGKHICLQYKQDHMWHYHICSRLSLSLHNTVMLPCMSQTIYLTAASCIVNNMHCEQHNILPTMIYSDLF